MSQTPTAWLLVVGEMEGLGVQTAASDRGGGRGEQGVRERARSGLRLRLQDPLPVAEDAVWGHVHPSFGVGEGVAPPGCVVADLRARLAHARGRQEGVDGAGAGDGRRAGLDQVKGQRQGVP
jgi:hypothetical protein